MLLVPVLVTFGVTLLRLVGELMEWSPRHFSRVAGGGLSIVGIAWLVPIVGFYLGYRLGRAQVQPSSLARAVGVPGAALVLAPTLAWLGSRLDSASTATGHFVLWAVVSLIVGLLAFAAWPRLGGVLAVYALAARLPVVAVMWFAIRGMWGTHYDAPPPSFPPMPPDLRWLWTGVLPQLTIWVAWTLVVGVPFGALGWFVASRRAD